MFYLTEEVTQILVQAGIPQHLREYVYEYHFYKKKETKVPQVFAFQDLEFGFEIWLGACGIATVVFIAEVLLNQLNNFIGLTGLLIILIKAKNV